MICWVWRVAIADAADRESTRVLGRWKYEMEKSRSELILDSTRVAKLWKETGRALKVEDATEVQWSGLPQVHANTP